MGLGKKAVVGAVFEAGGDLNCLSTDMLKKVALDERRNAALLGWLVEMVATSTLRCFEKLEDCRCKASRSISGPSNQANDMHVLAKHGVLLLSPACGRAVILCSHSAHGPAQYALFLSAPMTPPSSNPSDAGATLCVRVPF